MATGQTLLTLASIVLLAIISMNIRSMYVQSVQTTVNSQHTADALNYGRDLGERVQSYVFNYGEILNSRYASMNDINDPAGRDSTLSPANKMLYATTEIGNEIPVLYNHQGRLITIRIYERNDMNSNQFDFLAEYITAITDLNETN
ncbi:MAG: hypothetical protein EA391_14320 [Balneolaceae bacterium]|nr:MAG: hypothetical protein EA391_14320 [Balneolaceae bacterium]